MWTWPHILLPLGRWHSTLSRHRLRICKQGALKQTIVSPMGPNCRVWSLLSNWSSSSVSHGIFDDSLAFEQGPPNQHTKTLTGWGVSDYRADRKAHTHKHIPTEDLWDLWKLVRYWDPHKYRAWKDHKLIVYQGKKYTHTHTHTHK